MGFLDFISKPFNLIASVGKGIFNKVIKPVASWGGNLVKSVVDIPGKIVDGGTKNVQSLIGAGNNLVTTAGATVGNVANVAGNTLDKGFDTVGGIFKSPILLIGGGLALVLLMKK